MNPKTLIDRLAAAATVPAADGQAGGDQDAVDGVFVIGIGFGINYGSGRGAIQFITPDKSRSARGWVWFEADSVLANMFAWLHGVMPSFHRFSAVLVPYLIDPEGQSLTAKIMSHGFTEERA